MLPGATLVVLEKEAAVATHQSGHNSGVIHSGIYYKPGSLKAQLCLDGSRQLVVFCERYGVPHEICGKIIVATKQEELQGLEALRQRGEGHGIKGLRLLSQEEITDREPWVAGIRGLLVPTTGIVDYVKVAEAYAALIKAGGGAICFSHEVTSIRRASGSTKLETTAGDIEARLVVNCAGLHSDRISRMSGAPRDLTIVPFRGEYYDLTPAKEHCLRGLIYPVPDPRFPFLGVHFTRRITGGVEAGPNAVLAFAREGYSKTSFEINDILDYGTFPGFWKMASKHWQTSAAEYYRSWSKAAFLKDLQRLMPSLTADDLVPGGAGVRAQALDRQGQLVDDFRFLHTDGIVHVCNAPSPAATASLVIGKHIVQTALSHNGDAFSQQRLRGSAYA